MTDFVPVSDDGALELPDGVTADDAERVMSYAANDLSETTRRIYANQMKHFTEWCDRRGASALPAEPSVVASYLAERAPHRSVSWITQAAAAIRKAHTRASHEDPTAFSGVKRTLKGIRRTHGTPPTPKAAATTEDVRAMVNAVRASSPPYEPSQEDEPAARGRWLRARRNEAMILVGYAAALRRSEVAALELGHITKEESGVEILIPRSKGDQEGDGARVGVARGEDLCPVAALERWLLAAGITDGPIFRACKNTGFVGRQITPQTVGNVVSAAAEAARLEGNYEAHSLRRGHLTQAAMNGADLTRLQKQARHADPRTTARYIEDANRLETTTSRELGL